MKKCLSVLLAVAMLLGIMSMTCFATENIPVTVTLNSTQIRLTVRQNVEIKPGKVFTIK